MDKVEPCLDCGALILPSTVEENEGLCTPCLEEYYSAEDDTEDGWPHIMAFWAAAFLLVINASFTIFQMYFGGSFAEHVICLAVDVVLAWFLVQEDEIARLATLARAACGLIVPVTLRAMDDSVSGGVLETGMTQALFSGALILFLGWETVRLRAMAGALFGLLYLMYLGLIVVTLMF